MTVGLDDFHYFTDIFSNLPECGTSLISTKIAHDWLLAIIKSKALPLSEKNCKIWHIFSLLVSSESARGGQARIYGWQGFCYVFGGNGRELATMSCSPTVPTEVGKLGQ